MRAAAIVAKVVVKTRFSMPRSLALFLPPAH
jgi:hypothetical protein